MAADQVPVGDPAAAPVTDLEAQQEAQLLAERSARAMLAADRASAAAGVRLVTVSPGAATARLTVRDDMVNGHGVAHGGIVFLLADTAFALACNSYGGTVVAAGGDVTFVAPVRAGDELTARAREVVRYGRSGLYDVSVARGDGGVVAVLRGRSRLVAGLADQAGGGETEGRGTEGRGGG